MLELNKLYDILFMTLLIENMIQSETNIFHLLGELEDNI